MSKEEILTAIQGLAEKLGRVPTLTELKTMTPVGRRAVRTHFGTYTEALIQCGMETGRRFRIPMETLFADWARVARQIQRIPSASDYEEKGLHSTRPLQGRCGSWRKVPHMMLKYAQEEGLVAQWPDVMAMARAEKELKLAGHGKFVAGPRGDAVGCVYESSGVWHADEYGSAGACADERTGRGVSVWRDGARPGLHCDAAASGVS